MAAQISRRGFIRASAGMLTSAGCSSLLRGDSISKSDSAGLAKSPFRISVLTDEISQDFGHACEVASQQFGMGWVELRSMWKKNIVNLDEKEIAEVLATLNRNRLRVSDIASPLFKTDWPGAPASKFSERDQFNANFTYDQQGEVLERSIEIAKKLSADRIRCFDFWRLQDQQPYRAAINEQLQKAAEKIGKAGLTLVLENEPACNTATGAEAARTLAAVPSKHLMLNWDPGNAGALGEIPYPDGYKHLPKERIGHCHVKDVRKTAKGFEWADMGHGVVDWAGQFAALKRDGFRYAVSLETHWRGAGTPEASSIECWAGMKSALEKAGAL
jgi:sugar phosphate isomerase/epimerase